MDLHHESSLWPFPNTAKPELQARSRLINTLAIVEDGQHQGWGWYGKGRRTGKNESTKQQTFTVNRLHDLFRTLQNRSSRLDLDQIRSLLLLLPRLQQLSLSVLLIEGKESERFINYKMKESDLRQWLEGGDLTTGNDYVAI